MRPIKLTSQRADNPVYINPDSICYFVKMPKGDGAVAYPNLNTTYVYLKHSGTLCVIESPDEIAAACNRAHNT